MSLKNLSIAAIVCCMTLVAWPVAADTIAPDAGDLMPSPDSVIKKILGLDEMTKNVCLIDSHQMVNATDLPGRLVTISPDMKVPSDLLRYTFRKPGSKATTQVNPLTAPIQDTRIESSVAKSAALLTWLGASMSKDDIAELKTIPLPATSISVSDLDEQSISEKFRSVPESTRKGLGIVTDVIPYEVWASVCKKTTAKLQSGVWYIRLGKDTYSQQSDELRRYYLVAVYTPLVFYNDIGVISDMKSTSIEPEGVWKPSKPVKNRDEAFALWLKEQDKDTVPQGFSNEHHIRGLGMPEPAPQKPGATTDQSTTNGIKTPDLTVQDEKPQSTEDSHRSTTAVQ